MLEIEIKLRIRNLAEVRRQVRRVGFKPLTPRLFERNLVFDSAGHALRLSQQLLRLRSKGDRWWLTFKTRPEIGTRHKTRREIEIEVSEGQKLADILAHLGYRPVFEYQKYRTEFHQPGRPGKLLLDETPIGDYIELEGLPRWIDRTAEALGYSPKDYILASYSGLYFARRQAQGLPPGNMVFQETKRRGGKSKKRG